MRYRSREAIAKGSRRKPIQVNVVRTIAKSAVPVVEFPVEGKMTGQIFARWVSVAFEAMVMVVAVDLLEQ